MTQCLVHFFRRLPSGSENAMPWLMSLQDSRISHVIEMIIDEPGNYYTVESMAEAAAMSRSAFTAHFTKSFGRSPMNFVNHVRMQHAAHLLSKGELSIDQIGRSVGYSSRSHFSRSFKDHSGQSPKLFRSEIVAH